MSAPRTVPPAPAHAPVPLPNPQNAPTQKKYSEGSMYEDLSPEDVEAWHRRYAEFKEWRKAIPNKALVELGAGTGSSMSSGKGVGVGSADWSWSEPSDNGTIPSTIVERAWETARARSNLGPQAEPPAPSPPKSGLSKRSSKRNMNLQARVETLHATETRPSQPASKATTVRAPLSQKPVPSHNIANIQKTDKSLKTPTIEIQPPSSKSPNQVPLPSSKPAQSQAQHSISSQKPSSFAKPTRLPPTPLLAQPPSADKIIIPSSEPKIMSRSPSTRGSLVPGEQIIPSPTPSTKYAEREAYIASALSLPLDMLAETNGPPRTDSSTQFTTGRLDSLLGKGKSASRTKGSQRSVGSSSTLPSVRSENVAKRKASAHDLTRSQTASGVSTRSRVSERALTDHREHHYEGSNHLPVPGPPTNRSRAPSDATVVRAANQPLPPSAQSQFQASAIAPANSPATQASASRSAPPPTQPAASQATFIRASREPLPLSVPSATTHAETIKVPASVKTVIASSGPATKVPPTEATVSRAANIGLPLTTGRTGTVRSSASTVKTAGELLSARNVPLPPAVLTAASTAVPKKESAPTHRQQMPLPRPALTPQPSFDGLTKATSLGRKHRDPSLGDLTAHFEPSMYPLPPSGATLFSSPEQVGNLPSKPSEEHAVAFSTVEYIPPKSLKSTTQASTPAVQPTVQSRSVKSVPQTSASRAAAIPLPPSSAALSASSTPKATPSAPAPSTVSPPAPPPPPVTSPVEPAHVPATIRNSAAQEEVSRPVSNRLSNPPIEPPNLTQISTESRSPAHTHPHIHFSPGQVSQSLRSEDDHVSFEVPSGSRGRLRVTLKWFREGGRSDRGSPRTGRLNVVEEDAPPPLPPKTTSLMSKVMGKSSSIQRERPRSENPPPSTHQTSHAEDHRHPIPQDERPELLPPPPKRDDLKSPSSDDQYPPDQQAQQQHHPAGPAPFYNPYYSGATLPAYAAAMPQVYNMLSPPMAYPQPGLPAWGGPTGQYRPAQRGVMAQHPPPIDPASPARESVDPPSDMDPPPQPQIQLQSTQQPYQGYPPQMMGYPPQQGYWNGMTRPSIWQRMFRRPSQGQGEGHGQGEDNIEPDDSVTIRNWRKGVQPGGRAPTMLPHVTPQRGVPTVVPPRPTLANTAYPGTGMGMGMMGTSSGPGTTLYNARGGYPMARSPRERGRGREGTPSVWEKLMYRRQTEEAIYRSPPRKNRRNLPDPAPSPSPLSARKNIFSRSRSRTREVTKDRPRYEDDSTRRRRDKDDRYVIRQKGKDERRRQRSLRRDQRATAQLTQRQGRGQGLRREQFLYADERDRPGDLGVAPARGRSGTLVGEWVGKFGRGRTGQQFPNSESQVKNYQPRLWKDRLTINNRRTPGQVERTHAQPQPQLRTNDRGQRTTLRRTLRTTERVNPAARTGGNALGLGGLGLGYGNSQRQDRSRGRVEGTGLGMRGMIGRLNLNRKDGATTNRGRRM